ncbi:MAG: DUF1559 domain-containing protein, partial [Acidobacteriales bacterium]|nr:DUF1559 domain-containing protein [Terriglobales bacterium]
MTSAVTKVSFVSEKGKEWAKVELDYRSSQTRIPNVSGSVLTQLLPFVEQDNLWKTSQAAYKKFSSPFNNPPHIPLTTVMPTFGCPSDARSEQVLVSQL